MTAPTSTHPIKNGLLALGLMLFLTLSFKLAGDLSSDTVNQNASISVTDTVVSTLRDPVTETVK